MTTANSTNLPTNPGVAPPPALSNSELSIFSEAGCKLLWNMAKTYSASSIVPDTYRGKTENCFIALDMAMRLKINPLTVMQQLYIVHGRPAWSAQFLIGMFNNNPDFSPLRYQFEGEPGTDEWGCRAIAIELATGEALAGTLITIGLAKKEKWYEKDGSKWKTMPEQMLRYRAAAWFIRAYAPEQGMGMMTREEVIDMDRDSDGVWRTAPEDTNGQSAPDLNAALEGTVEDNPAPKAPEPPKEEPWDGASPPTMPKPKRKPIDEIDAISAECWDICNKRSLPLDDMLAEAFPETKKDKLTLEQWQKFRASLD